MHSRFSWTPHPLSPLDTARLLIFMVRTARISAAPRRNCVFGEEWSTTDICRRISEQLTWETVLRV